MGRFATEGKKLTPAPAGTHLARCIKIIDLGTQHGEYNGKPNKRNQVIIMFELPNETVQIEGQEKPALVSQFFTNSLSEKSNLRPALESWRGRPFTTEELLRFDLESILGKPALVTIVHKDDKAKISSIAKIMKGMETTLPEQVNPSFSFWIDDWDQEKFDTLSDRIKAMIQGSDEYKAKFGESNGAGSKKANGPADDLDDDIPF